MDEPSRPVVRLRRRPDAVVAADRSTPAPRRRRHQRGRVALATAVGVLLGFGVVATIAVSADDGADDGDELLVLESPSTSRPVRPSTTTTTTVPRVTVPFPPLPPTPVSPGAPAPLAPGRTTTTTTAPTGGGGSPTPPPDCRDSTDPVCGPWYWDPEPAPNQPLNINVTYYDLLGQPTQTPIFRASVAAHLADADAPIVCWRMVTDNGEVLYSTDCVHPPCPTRYGPWTPPAVQAGAQDLPLTSLRGGTVVTVHAESAGYGCNPYGSAADV